MNIFIGNSSYNVIGGDLRHAFEAFGEVSSATIVKDKQSGRSAGYGLIRMPDQAEVRAAIAALNGKAFKGRMITVNETRPHAEKRRSKDRGGV